MECQKRRGKCTSDKYVREWIKEYAEAFREEANRTGKYIKNN